MAIAGGEGREVHGLQRDRHRDEDERDPSELGASDDEDGGIAAAKAGHDVVMAPQKPTYFDHAQSKDPREPMSIGGHNSLADVYAYEPVPAALSGSEAARVLGAQAQVWTEWMPDARHVEYMTWPRLCAMAEVLWSPRETRDADDFMRRLRAHLERLQALDVNYRRLDPA